MTTETINIIVRENGSRVVKRDFELLGRQAITTNSSISVLSRSLLGLSGGISVAVGIRSAISTLADFSQALSTVKAITGATEDQFKPLEAEIKKLGATTRFTATQAAEGAAFLARAGFDAQQTTESLAATLTLAQSTATGFGRAADIVTNIMTAFRIETTETARVGDVLAMAVNRSNTNLSQLGDAMKFVAPVAKGLNVGLEETVAMISALSDAGLQGSIAGTGLRRVMTELEIAVRKGGKSLKEVGIDSEDVQVSVVGMATALLRLRDAGFDVGRAMEFFGQRGGPAAENLISVIPKITKMTEELKNSQGFMAEVARVMDDNLNGAILAVRSAVEALIIQIGDSGAFTVLQGIMGTLAEVIRFVARNLDAFAIALQAVIGVKIIAFIADFIARNKALAASIASGNSVLLTSVSIEKAKAASSLQMATASNAAAAAKVRELQLGLSQLAQNKALLLEQAASIKIDTQRRMARDALTGRLIAYKAAVAQNIQTNIALQRTEQAMIATKAQLSAATTAQTATTTALAAAQTRNAAATAASATMAARLSAAFPLLAGAIGSVNAALTTMKVLLAPYAIMALIASLYIFRDEIKVTSDGMTSLGDVFRSAWEVIGQGARQAMSIFQTFAQGISGLVSPILKLLADNIILVTNVLVALGVAYVTYNTAMIAFNVATKAATAIMWLFNAALLANPLTLLTIAAVAGSAALIYLAGSLSKTADAADESTKALEETGKSSFSSAKSFSEVEAEAARAAASLKGVAGAARQTNDEFEELKGKVKDTRTEFEKFNDAIIENNRGLKKTGLLLDDTKGKSSSLTSTTQVLRTETNQLGSSFLEMGRNGVGAFADITTAAYQAAQAVAFVASELAANRRAVDSARTASPIGQNGSLAGLTAAQRQERYRATEASNPRRNTQAISSSSGSFMLPGFARGGSFKVGGVTGTDQNLVQFRATRGEIVDIKTPQQQRTDGETGGREQKTVIIEKIELIVVGVQDANDFRRTERQLMSQLSGAISKAVR